MMDQEIKTQWVSALRSGEYKQGREELRRDDRFCVFGVLCDLAVKAGMAEWRHEPQQAIWDGMEKGFYGPTWRILVWADLRGNFDSVRELAELNDSGWSFEQIATLIEEKL